MTLWAGYATVIKVIVIGNFCLLFYLEFNRATLSSLLAEYTTLAISQSHLSNTKIGAR